MGTHDNIQGPLPDDQNQNGSSGQGSSHSNTGSGQQGQPGSSAGSNTGQAGQNTASNSNTQSGSNTGQNSSSSGTNSSQSNSNTGGSQGTPATQPGAVGEATAGVNQNVSDTTAALSKAKNTISDLMDGKANIVDAAMAAKGAFDAVKGLSGKISESLMMPVMKALGAFKGQAILPAAKQMDPVMGIDVHMVTIPPSPAPIPMPHPYIGMLFNAKDFVSCAINTFKKDLLDALPAPAPDDKSCMASLAKNKEAIAGIAMAAMNMSASVKFGDFIPRAVTGTPTKSIPHIPMGAGFFPAFHAAVEKNVGKAFLGSLFVVADGDPMVGSFHLNYDCWDIGIIDLFKSQRKGAIKSPPPAATKAELFVPSGTVMPIPLGRPVLVNSIPTPINPLSIVDKLFKAGLGKLAGLARKIAQKGLDKLNGKVGCGILSAASKAVGTGQSHPVDVASGHFYTDNIDFKLPGPIPFEFERTWQSYSIYEGPLGYGWHHSYDLALAIDFAENAAIMRLGDGRIAHFEIPTKEKEAYNRREKLTICLHEDGYYYATDKKGLIYRFTDKTHFNPFNKTETHLLQSIANRNGFAIRFSYDKNCTLTEIIDSAGRKLIVNNDGMGYITDIQAPDPRFQGRSTFAITKYTYTPEGDMTSQADALDQAMHYTYEQHQMVREVWRNGCVWQFRYDKTSGPDAKCVEVFGTGGLLHYKFDYTDPTCTIATNSRGFKKQFHHRNGVVTKFVDPLGAAWEYRYNSFNELEAETDPLGNFTCYTYDNLGNMLSRIDPDGTFSQTQYKSSVFKNFPTEAQDIRGGKWFYEYDDVGNLVKSINPVGAITKYSYSDGKMSLLETNNGIRMRLTYDSDFNLRELIKKEGDVTRYEYDVLGNCISIINPLSKKLKQQYDIKGRRIEVTDFDSNMMNITYDPADNIIHFKDNLKEIRYSFSSLSKITSRTEAGDSLQFKYDNEGDLICVHNEQQFQYIFERDANGNVNKEVGFDNSVNLYERDSCGNIIKAVRSSNRFTSYAYDEVGRVISVIYDDGEKRTFSYNKGEMISAVNPDAVVEFEHDIIGNVIKESCNENHINAWFDGFSRRTKLSSSLGADINFTYDDYDKLTGLNAGSWNLNVNSNETNSNIHRIYPGGITEEWNSDSFGRLASHIVKKAEKSNSNGYQWQYKWHFSNHILRISEPGLGNTDFEYDDCGNLSRTLFHDGIEQFRNPDSVFNLFGTANKSDKLYAKGNQLIKSRNAEYKYDSEGYLLEKKESDNKTWKYEWSSSGLLKKVINPENQSIQFKYDALGRRIEKKYKSTLTKWQWENDKPLHEWKEFDTKESSVDDIITWVFEENAFTPTAKLKGKSKFSIIKDHAGTPIQSYNEEGDLVWSRELDSYGKVRMHKGEEGFCNFLFQGQTYDYETGLAYNRFRYYNPDEGLYISKDPIGLNSGQLNLYAYVKDPNLWVDVFGLVEGGSYSKVRNSNTGGEVHHMPAASVNESTGSTGHGSAPAIMMTTDDHSKTASHGSSTKAAAYRDKQEQHITNGRYDLAMGMDIRDVSRKFPGKYKDSMLLAIEYARTRKPPLITDEQARNLRRQCK